MGKTIIVSEETLRDLLEAHASLSAWYYQLWAALRRAGATASSPDDAARAAFVARLADDFPEVAAVARSIQAPRLFVPPPALIPPPAPVVPTAPDGEPTTAVEPATARARDLAAGLARSAEDWGPAPVSPAMPGKGK